MGSLLRSVTLMDLSLSLNTSRVLSGVTEAWLEKLTAVASSASAGTTIFAVLVRLNMDHSLITLLVY
ncbi:hypothetical protein QU762_00015 [Escherichia coli]|uniref:hypothetical protein n=1 Tax=Escherichia coli TaxID=562 RepID=UPI000AC8B12B|nr:hypothetical protein [Escherichia coli]MCZ5723496.1 hypothetical protein [Escherichia coli]MDM9327762.1 hypothetical protein [Escherichia coli]WNU74954.1 hypothetical protein RS160_08005 [Escherichia coli]